MTKVRTKDVHGLQELVTARNALTRAIARYEGGSVNLGEQGTDHRDITPTVPPELSIEVLGAALGLVNTRLIAKGVTVPEISEHECFECDGTGTQPR